MFRTRLSSKPGRKGVFLITNGMEDIGRSEAVFAVVKREDLETALRQVEHLIRPPEDKRFCPIHF